MVFMETPSSFPATNSQIIFSWKAPLRPYKKRSKIILRFYIAVTLLLSLILFFFGDRILLLPLWAILFLFYILTITPPPEVENKITKFGVETAGITLRWETLSHFYFAKRFGFFVLTIVGHAPFNYHSFLVIPDDSVKNQTIHLLSEHLIYQEKPEKTIVDRMVDFFMKLIPDEEDGSVNPQSFSPIPKRVSI